MRVAHISKLALLLTGAMHVAMLWLLLQTAPMVQTARSVVHYLAPITLLPEQPVATPELKHITTPQPVRQLKTMQEPVLPVPPVTAPKSIELPAEKPVAQKPPPVVPVLPVLEPVPQEVVLAPTPVPAPIPMPIPVPAPVPEKPVPLPVPEPVPTPAMVAAPVPAAVPTPTLVVAPAPAAPMPAPIAAAARPAAITPVEPAPAGAQSTASAGGSAPPALVKPLTGIYPNMYNPSRQRSLSELANEQLNGGRRRDSLADGVGAAEIPDCVGPNTNGTLFGLLTIPVAAATGKCKLSK